MLFRSGALFEYWSHAACFLPIEDYQLYRPGVWRGEGSRKWLEEHPQVAETVLNHIRANGEARSSDFERTDGQASGWFNWKEEKVALVPGTAFGACGEGSVRCSYATSMDEIKEAMVRIAAFLKRLPRR